MSFFTPIPTLTVKQLPGLSYTSDITAVGNKLDALPKATLDFAPWPEYPCKPQVQFAISYNSDCIFLKYYVEEKSIRAVNSAVNSPVWEDSCVEFFLSFNGEEYYNLEFNCLGTALVGFGSGKENRVLLSPANIETIKTRSTILRKDTYNYWELTLVIPLKLFVHNPLTQLQGTACKANFYKCGDLLPEPHFVTWSNINYGQPNFHLPEFFGLLIFA